MIDASLVEQMETTLPPPARSVEESDRQGAASLDLVKGRSSPNGAFAMNDSIISGNDLGGVKGDIQFTGRKRGGKLDTGPAPHEDADARLFLREACEDRRQQGIAVFLGHPKSDLTLLIRSPHSDESLVERFDDPPRKGQELVAMRRQRDAAPMPVEQLPGGDLLELLHLEADGGLGSEQAGRAATHASGLGDREEAAQQVAVELGQKDIVFPHI